MTTTPAQYIVESTTRRALAEASAAATISAEALAWVNARTAETVALCAATGRRTPSGRLMAPPDGAPASAPVVIRQPDPVQAQDGRRRPERLDARAKEWQALSIEEKTAHLQAVYVSAPAVNEEAIDLLLDIAAHGSNQWAARAREIIDHANDLLPQKGA